MHQTQINFPHRFGDNGGNATAFGAERSGGSAVADGGQQPRLASLSGLQHVFADVEQPTALD